MRKFPFRFSAGKVQGKKGVQFETNDTVVPSVVLFAVVAGDHQIAEEREYGK